MEEMRQSARIVKQALEGMPEGAWQADAPHVVLPDREKMKTQMEALIYHFKIVTEGFRVPAGEVYPGDRIAARRDRLLRGQRWHVEAVPGAFMRTPSFGNLQALPRMIEGDRLLADRIAVWAAWISCLGDVDRDR